MITKYTLGKAGQDSTEHFNVCQVFLGDDPVAQLYGLPLHSSLEDVEHNDRFAVPLAKAKKMVAALNDMNLRDSMIKKIEHDYFFDYSYYSGTYGHYVKGEDCTADYRAVLEAMNTEYFLDTYTRVQVALSVARD